jgi:hypothetical protein
MTAIGFLTNECYDHEKILKMSASRTKVKRQSGLFIVIIWKFKKKD